MNASTHLGAHGRAVARERIGQGVEGAPAETRVRGGMLTANGWAPGADLDLRQWLEHGRRLGMVGRGVAWWIGDWLVYGNARYGERYARAARATGYDVQSLMNMVYVASRFVPMRRRASLSWSHHAEVAALPVEDQDRWLDLAERERMSVRSLRTELRTWRRVVSGRASAERLPEPAARPSEQQVVCPHCRSVIPRMGAAS